MAERNRAAADAEQPASAVRATLRDGANDAQRAARRAQALSLLTRDRTDPRLNRPCRRLTANAWTASRPTFARSSGASRSPPSAWTVRSRCPAGRRHPEDLEEHIKLMYDLLALAWQTEITRISTFMLAKELSNAVYPKSGVLIPFTFSRITQHREQQGALCSAESLSRAAVRLLR